MPRILAASGRVSIIRLPSGSTGSLQFIAAELREELESTSEIREEVTVAPIEFREVVDLDP